MTLRVALNLSPPSTVSSAMARRGFDEFYAAYFDEVARAITLAAGDRELARDATQEAFARALRRWRRVGDMDRPDGWVYVVAMNRLRDHWRTRERQPQVEPAAADKYGSVVIGITVREAIATLPPRQRQAVVLRYLADLPLAAVAEAMGCALGTAKATLHQALRAMRVELEDDDEN
jgi:RNA polymerase sigma-70 factor, ECF subfamily